MSPKVHLLCGFRDEREVCKSQMLILYLISTTPKMAV